MTPQRKAADRRAASRPEASQGPGRPARRGWIVAGTITGVALVAFIVASFSAGDQQGAAGLEETAPVTVTGVALPQYPDTGADPAVGMTLPDLEGVSFDGTPVSITNDGRAKVLLVLAHW